MSDDSAALWKRPSALEAEERELEKRAAEASRRFSVVKQELLANQVSLVGARGSLANRIVLPQLLDGSWVASGDALSLIVSDYELIARLSTFYGRIRELQWRLRSRVAVPIIQQIALEGMTERLIEELDGEVGPLIQAVEAQIADPSVELSQLRTVGGADAATVYLRITPS